MFIYLNDIFQVFENFLANFIIYFLQIFTKFFSQCQPNFHLQIPSLSKFSSHIGSHNPILNPKNSGSTLVLVSVRVYEKIIEEPEVFKGMIFISLNLVLLWQLLCMLTFKYSLVAIRVKFDSYSSVHISISIRFVVPLCFCG